MNLVTYGDRQTGKTEAMLRAITWELVIENRRIVVVCHDVTTARNTMERFINDHLAPLSVLDRFLIRRSNGNLSINAIGAGLHQGRVQFLSYRTGSRGFVVDSLFLDDVQDGMPESAREALLPCLSGSPEPRLHEYICNPEAA